MNRPHIISAAVVIQGPGMVVRPYCDANLRVDRVVPTNEFVNTVYPAPVGEWLCPECYRHYMESQKSFKTEAVQLVVGEMVQEVVADIQQLRTDPTVAHVP